MSREKKKKKGHPFKFFFSLDWRRRLGLELESFSLRKVEAKMLDMAEKPKRRRGRPSGRKEIFPIQVNVSRQLFEALNALAGKNRRSKNAELIIALEERLQANGLWPPFQPQP